MGGDEGGATGEARPRTGGALGLAGRGGASQVGGAGEESPLRGGVHSARGPSRATLSVAGSAAALPAGSRDAVPRG